LSKNWQTRAWDPVFKTAGSAPDAAMILRLFSQKNLKINIDRKLYWIVQLYLHFFCASSEWYSNNQNYEVKQGRKFFLQIPKSKTDKKHLYAIFPYKNNNHIFYDYSEINQKGPRQFERRDYKQKMFSLPRDILYVTLCSNQE
jgi:hypothetical protein